MLIYQGESRTTLYLASMIPKNRLPAASSTAARSETQTVTPLAYPNPYSRPPSAPVSEAFISLALGRIVICP